jgi:hypothetical protein
VSLLASTQPEIARLERYAGGRQVAGGSITASTGHHCNFHIWTGIEALSGRLPRNKTQDCPAWRPDSTSKSQHIPRHTVISIEVVRPPLTLMSLLASSESRAPRDGTDGEPAWTRPREGQCIHPVVVLLLGSLCLVDRAAVVVVTLARNRGPRA